MTRLLMKALMDFNPVISRGAVAPPPACLLKSGEPIQNPQTRFRNNGILPAAFSHGGCCCRAVFLLHDPVKRAVPMQTDSIIQIHQLLRPESIRVGLPGETKAQVLEGLIGLLDGHPGVRDVRRVYEAVSDREQVMSTGVGKGLALPHAKTAAVLETVAAFAVTEHPIPFGAIDDQPVRLLFLLIGTEEAKSQHLKILSRISRLMNREAFRDELLHAHDAADVIRIIEQGETELL